MKATSKTLIWLLAGFPCLGVATGASGGEFAVSFNGTNQSAAASGTSATYNLFPLTLMLWVKTDQANGSGAIVSKRNNTLTNGYEIVLTNGQLRAFYARSANNYIFDGDGGVNGAFIADTNWHHLAFAVDTNGGRLYLDGALQDSLPWTGPAGAINNTASFQLATGPEGYFRGTIDEVSVWTSALTAAQIQSEYRLYVPTNAPGLFAYWRCDEGVASTVRDATGNSHNLSLANSPLWVSPAAPVGYAPTLLTQAATDTNFGPSATLNGTVTPYRLNTLAWFQWGTTTNYSNSTPMQVLGNGANPLNISQIINGLTLKSNYNFRVAASNFAGVTFGTNRVFRAIQPPNVVAGAATAVGSTNGTINAAVTANMLPALAWFEWGATTNYGNTNGAQSLAVTTPTAISNVLNGLQPAFAVHWRVAASNEAGVVKSADQMFTPLLPALESNSFTAGLEAYWPFDETSGTNAWDWSGGTSHGRLLNFPTNNWQPGRVNGALRFNGTNYVIVTNYPKATTNLSVAAWIWTGSRPANATIARNWGDSNAGQFQFGLSSGGFLQAQLQLQGPTTAERSCNSKARRPQLPPPPACCRPLRGCMWPSWLTARHCICIRTGRKSLRLPIAARLPTLRCRL